MIDAKIVNNNDKIIVDWNDNVTNASKLDIIEQQYDAITDPLENYYDIWIRNIDFDCTKCPATNKNRNESHTRD